MTLTPWNISLVAVLGLVGIGFYALLASHNLIKVIVALQVVAKGAILAMVVAGKLQGQMAVGQSMALTVIVADTLVAVVGLALSVQIRQHCGSLDLRALSNLRR